MLKLYQLFKGLMFPNLHLQTNNSCSHQDYSILIKVILLTGRYLHYSLRNKHFWLLILMPKFPTILNHIPYLSHQDHLVI